MLRSGEADSLQIVPELLPDPAIQHFAPRLY
jgi:hypothetical protein